MALLITDPVDWKRDPVTGDVVVPIQYVSGLEGVAQGIDGAVQLTKGEWFLDRGAGQPWIENDFVDESEAILSSPFSAALARAALRPAILAVPGVDSISDMQVTFDGESRGMSVTFTVQTIWGLPVTGTAGFAL